MFTSLNTENAITLQYGCKSCNAFVENSEAIVSSCAYQCLFKKVCGRPTSFEANAHTNALGCPKNSTRWFSTIGSSTSPHTLPVVSLSLPKLDCVLPSNQPVSRNQGFTVRNDFSLGKYTEKFQYPSAVPLPRAFCDVMSQEHHQRTPDDVSTNVLRERGDTHVAASLSSRKDRLIDVTNH